MPKNKSYEDRKKILNELFRTRYYSLEGLVHRINNRLDNNVKERTVEKDIKDMRAEGAPIVHQPGKGYAYEPRNYNLFEVKVYPDSISKMKQAAMILRQIPGLELHDDLMETIERLEMRIQGDDEENMQIQFDTKPEYAGRKYLSELFEAILGGTVVTFQYKPFHLDDPKNIVLHPYLLKEYNNRWFVIGLTEDFRKKNAQRISSFGLERIKTHIKPVPTVEYFYSPHFKPEIYFKDIIGITVNEPLKIERVILKFSKNRCPYIETNPLHQSQTLLKNRETTLAYDLIPNKELETLILSFGPDVEVLEPIDLRQRISCLIKNCSNIYDDGI